MGCEPLVFVHFILCQSELCAHRRFWFTTFASHSCSDCWSRCTRQTCPSRKINYSHSHSNPKIQRGLLSRVVISLFTEHCKNSVSALCQEKAVFSPLHVFEKGQKLINCRIAPLTKDGLVVVLFGTSKRDSFSVAASFITPHFSAKWNGQTVIISRKFTSRQGVLYFHEQSELHITWNL